MSAPKPLRILIAEDRPDDAELILMHLRREGYEPQFQVVDTPGTFRAALLQKNWDFVLSDYEMGSWNAPVALSILKECELDLPFVIVSGTIGEETAVESMRAGAHDFLVKGKLTRLAAIIEREVREASNRRERREEERIARAASDYHAMLLGNLNDAVIATDGHLNVTAWNRGAERVYGWRREEAVGRTMKELLPTEAADGLSLADIVQRTQGEGRLQQELLQRTRAGSHIHVESTSVALRNEDDKLLGYVFVNRDVSPRVRAEEENRQAQDQLAQAQKMEAVGRLASGVAHDFNNLLAVILNHANFLLEDLPAGDARKADAEGVQKAGERAVRLIQQLLVFGCNSPAQPVPVNPNVVAEGVWKLLSPTLGEDVTLWVALTPEPWHTTIDPAHFEQVLMNLALNARDAMPGGGELRIEIRNAKFEQPPRACKGLRPGRYVVVSVRDTGCGMGSDVMSRIFEPFFTTKKGKATGLGLATVYGLVEQARGKIVVHSERGRGTEFIIYLPACDEGEQLTLPVPKDAPQRELGGGETVLVVEDEEGVRAVVRRILERNGFSVLESRGGDEALLQLEEHGGVKVILSDIVMPEGSGADLAAKVGAVHPEVPVILMSGYADQQNASYGFGVVLPKPFTEDALISRVWGALTRASQLPPAPPPEPPAPETRPEA
jgi:PAS domain S-box-containing protein